MECYKMTNLYFKVKFDTSDIENIDGRGKDLAVFLEEYLNGDELVDVRYIGHL